MSVKKLRPSWGKNSDEWSPMCTTPMPPSPVDVALREGPRGDCNWPGYDSVRDKISAACEKMGRAPNVRLGEEHVQAMADLGSGHEERMKARLHWLRAYGWVDDRRATVDEIEAWIVRAIAESGPATIPWIAWRAKDALAASVTEEVVRHCLSNLRLRREIKIENGLIRLPK